ncbi:MAG TPA: NAD(P)-dependent oxidoreductase [Bryobacteraceae bacterium]|nr:NAD(P)-dependent oxidoreductase [Bryobacteraceae bacterium]
MSPSEYIIGPDDPILITGAAGFIGSRLVEALLDRGFRNIRCFARPYGKAGRIETLLESHRPGTRIELVKGNLLSPEDCVKATEGVPVIFHLAAGRGEKSFPEAFMNSVVTTRNLMEAAGRHQCVRRFVNISSFAVYTNRDKPGGKLLDESSPIEVRPEGRGDAYSFAKVKQEEMVRECGNRLGIPYVIVRPGYVYGPGNRGITARVGIGTFGIFLHLGGFNTIPFTYVDNCADAIALAGLRPGVDGEIFNIVDDDLPRSRQFLRQYKKNVRSFRSIYLPHAVSYGLCYLWERYSTWSEGQLPPTFNRRDWNVTWKSTRYSNQKLKTRLGWAPKISTQEGLRRYFDACRNEGRRA